MDYDNLMVGLDQKSNTGLDPEGKWAPGVHQVQQIPGTGIPMIGTPQEELIKVPSGIPAGMPQPIQLPPLEVRLKDLAELIRKKELTYAQGLVAIGFICVNPKECDHALDLINKTLGITEEQSKFIEEIVSESFGSSEVVAEEVNEQPLENNNISANKYPEGVINYPPQFGVEKLKIDDPKPEYPFEDFELTITRIYDDGRKEEVNNMILGFRGSIKGYVKVYKTDEFKDEDLLYGFKQVIKNKKDRKPLINIGVKYHNSKGELITPVFGRLGDEKISEGHLNFQLV